MVVGECGDDGDGVVVVVFVGGCCSLHGFKLMVVGECGDDG